MFARPMQQGSHPRKRPPSVWESEKRYCWAAVFLAGELMRADGITDVRYVTGDTSVDNSQWLARGETDLI